MNSTHLIASSCAALTVWLLELLWCFKEELAHIWRTPFTCIKAIYVFAKYFPLLAHITNLCLFAYFESPFPAELCRKWFLFHHFSIMSAQIPFDIVVCLRVFALYNYSITIGILAVTTVSTDAVATLLAGLHLYRQAKFGSLCSTVPGKVALIVPTIFQTSQGIMWCLASYKKRTIGPLDPGLRTQLPFLPIIFRDSSLTVAVISLSFALSVPYHSLIRLETHILYPWGTTLLSILCCRLVLNTYASALTDTGAQEVELDDLGELPLTRCSRAK